jgi:hypothetical protein
VEQFYSDDCQKVSERDIAAIAGTIGNSSGLWMLNRTEESLCTRSEGLQRILQIRRWRITALPKFKV